MSKETYTVEIISVYEIICRKEFEVQAEYVAEAQEKGWDLVNEGKRPRVSNTVEPSDLELVETNIWARLKK